MISSNEIRLCTRDSVSRDVGNQQQLVSLSYEFENPKSCVRTKSNTHYFGGGGFNQSYISPNPLVFVDEISTDSSPRIPPLTRALSLRGGRPPKVLLLNWPDAQIRAKVLHKCVHPVETRYWKTSPDEARYILLAAHERPLANQLMTLRRELSLLPPYRRVAIGMDCATEDLGCIAPLAYEIRRLLRPNVRIICAVDARDDVAWALHHELVALHIEVISEGMPWTQRITNATWSAEEDESQLLETRCSVASDDPRPCQNQSREGTQDKRRVFKVLPGKTGSPPASAGGDVAPIEARQVISAAKTRAAQAVKLRVEPSKSGEFTDSMTTRADMEQKAVPTVNRRHSTASINKAASNHSTMSNPTDAVQVWRADNSEMLTAGSQCSVGLRPGVRYENCSTDIVDVEFPPPKPPSKLDAPRLLEACAVGAGTESSSVFLSDVTYDETIAEILLFDRDSVDRASNAAAYGNSFAIQRLLCERRRR
jgi:hypothetical protein